MIRSNMARKVLGSLLASGLLACGAISAKGGGTVAAASIAHTSRYCQLVGGAHSAETSAFSSLTTPGQAESAIKSAYQKFKADESKILSVVPSQLKGAYQTLFSMVNVIFDDLAKVNFDYTKLNASMLKNFEADSSSMASASEKIAAYAKNVCHINLVGAGKVSGGPTATMPPQSSGHGVSVGTKLPASFPKSIPLPASGTLVAVVSMPGAGYDLWYAVSGSQASVYHSYETAIEKAGATVSSSGTMPKAEGGVMVFVAGAASWSDSATVFPSGSAAGIPTSDLKAGQVEVAVVVGIH